MSFDLDTWDAWSPDQIAARLGGVGVSWAVAGGWAIELFVGRPIRPHDDLEIVIDQRHFGRVQRSLAELEWFAASSGSVRPFDGADDRLEKTWQTWGWDQAGRCWRVDVMREPWTEIAWAYRRRPEIQVRLTDAIKVTAAGVRYLSPEIVLLFKAKHQREKDDLDFDVTVSLLSRPQREWLAGAIRSEQPEHPWLDALG